VRTFLTLLALTFIIAGLAALANTAEAWLLRREQRNRASLGARLRQWRREHREAARRR
jgi:Ni/Co efflux regulator RcnB